MRKVENPAVGDRIRYWDGRRYHPGRVLRVYGYNNGRVDLEWTGPLPHPFFTGPYNSVELEYQ